MKPRGWQPTGSNALVYRALQAAYPQGLTSVQLRAALPGINPKTLEGTTWRLKADGWLAQAESGGPWTVVPSRGLPPYTGSPEAMPAGLTLHQRALALLQASTPGLDTAQLAQMLEASEEAVDAALETDVARHALVTCTVIRDGHKLVHYRASACGPRSHDWASQSTTAFDKSMAQRAKGVAQGSLPHGGVSADEKAALLAPAAGQAETPTQVIERLVFPGRARPEQAAPECAVRPEPEPENQCFECALYSTGSLVIESDGRCIELPLEHTRRLLHYLDGLRADDIVERALREVA